MLGKTYLLEDSLKAPKWRILNQIKEVAGYVCMKAETYDPIKNQKVTAWFAEQLPGEAGPEQYFGLPGVILELDLNEGDVVITATKVVLESPSEDDFKLPKRMKGKKINQQEYDRLLSKHIEDSIKAFRNPYWSLRY
jgi:GLPGLI family protein